MLRDRNLFFKGGAVYVLLAIALTEPSLAQSKSEKVLIRTQKPYSAVVAAIQNAGGQVTQQFNYVDGIAAEVPSEAIVALQKLVGANAVSRDIEIGPPQPAPARPGGSSEITFASDFTESGSGAENAALQSYSTDNTILGLDPLHSAGTRGSGVVVAVIDSGIRGNLAAPFPVCSAAVGRTFPALTVGGCKVIGGEDLVGDGLGFSHPSNNPHGTQVASLIVSGVTFCFGNTTLFAQAINAFNPAAGVPCTLTSPPGAPGTRVAMTGTAPEARVYALRTFPPAGGAPESRIIAAIERAITLRELWNTGQPGGVNIRVVNLSLGNSTLFAGRDLFDKAVDKLLAADIVPVVAAGNTGPSSLTVGSPGTSFGALTVGSASFAANDRVQLALSFGLGGAAALRPSGATQTALFSGRGPDADGRTDPDVMASGVGTFTQGSGATPGTTNIISGSSFSTPPVSGVAAVLRQAFPAATARQIRNAIADSANPGLITDGSNAFDQGHGVVDAKAARDLLATGTVPDTVEQPGPFNKKVKENIEHGADPRDHEGDAEDDADDIERGAHLRVQHGRVQQSFSNLKPGQRGEVLYDVTPNTKEIFVTVSGVVPSVAGGNVILAVHSAKTSAIGSFGDYYFLTPTAGGTFVVTNFPETGIVRVTLIGNGSNAGAVSADVAVSTEKESLPKHTADGKIDVGQSVTYPIKIASGVAVAEFRLTWREDWSNFPLNNIDMLVSDPNGATIPGGNSLSDPEVVTVNNPMPGTWLVKIVPFSMPAGEDKFELRVALDGKVVK